MPLTPIDVQQKTFGPELRGYNMDEVDDFLDEVVTTLKDYDLRLRDAQDRIRALETELASRGDDESAISRALVAAQKQADAILAEAQGEADRIRSEAYDETEEFRAARDAERMELNQEIARMRATMADLKRRVVDLADSIGADLDRMDEAAAEAAGEISAPLPITEPPPSHLRGYEEAEVGAHLDPFEESGNEEEPSADSEGETPVVDLVSAEVDSDSGDQEYGDDHADSGEEDDPDEEFDGDAFSEDEPAEERSGRRRPWERDSV